ncbi:MAG TPA: hypothetical protein VGK59_03460 [Ohtaekwangia sp.]
MDFEKNLNAIVGLLEGKDLNHILGKIENSEVIISKPKKMSTKQCLIEHETHYMIQKESTKNNQVIGYELLLSQLKNELNNTLLIFTLTTDVDTYILFITEGLDRLVGVLTSKGKNVKKLKELNQIYHNRGFFINNKRFFKKILQPD